MSKTLWKQGIASTWFFISLNNFPKLRYPMMKWSSLCMALRKQSFAYCDFSIFLKRRPRLFKIYTLFGSNFNAFWYISIASSILSWVAKTFPKFKYPDAFAGFIYWLFFNRFIDSWTWPFSKRSVPKFM